jgi:hypothetical protein
VASDKPGNSDDDLDISQFLGEEEEEGKIQAKDLGFMLRFLYPYLRPYGKHLALIGVLLAVQTVFNASFPLATQYLIDEGLIERDWNALVLVLGFLSAAAIGVFFSARRPAISCRASPATSSPARTCSSSSFPGSSCRCWRSSTPQC